ncbi:hypothetical protein RHMOL_Rhmol04G0330100 [Rhododendron molle]|uniref:Uncharacterized protein n=1 Tax=Rhododendron molle TaxID=49168 RepID=A0ACC0P8F5_RHOML|nr:hypothetical protein RHMOL_Rhmol04G0330100 [Rhododendron molle]
MEQKADAYRPTIMVTNDDGIDAPGLQDLVRVLVSTGRYEVQVCAPDSEKSVVSHSITWRTAVSVQQVNINGATAFAVSGTPADCTSLGISGSLFPSKPDLVALSLLLLYENVNDFITLSLYPRVYLHIVWYRSVISGINKGRNCGYHIVTSGTVAGAREAFFNGIPALSLSYDWVGGTSKVDDYTLAAEACLPIVNAMFAEIKNKTYPQKCFLNVNLPTNVASHKGYKLTKQGKSIAKMGWNQVTSAAQGGKMLSTMTMETNSLTSSEMDASTMPKEHRLFKREIRRTVADEDDTEYRSLQEGYVCCHFYSLVAKIDLKWAGP